MAKYNLIVRGAALALVCGVTACSEPNEDVFGSDPTGSTPSPGTGALPGTDGGPPVTAACQVAAGGTPDMVVVPGGEFVMGCNPEVDGSCNADEYPTRVVMLNDFQMDATEVTQDQYMDCATNGPCPPPTCQWDCAQTALPASCVNRASAMTYCSWAGKRLPTEAEWEKAARGTDGRKYPWGNDEPTCGHVNMAGCVGGPTAVGSLPAGISPYGALDMAGNMVEITGDWYDPNYYQLAPNVDPRGPSAGSTYVGRGGGFRSDPYWQRASVRDWYDPQDAGAALGFRCAR